MIYARPRIDNGLHADQAGSRGASKLGRIAIVGLLVAFLLWHLVTKQVASYLAPHAPETALLLDASHPVALVTLADRLLNGSAEGDDASDAVASGPQIDLRGPLGRWSALASSAVAPESSEAAPRLAEADRARVKTMAQTALRRDPLNHRAMRILGQLADAEGDRDRARQFMQAAARRSMRSTYAVYWLMLDSAASNDFVSSIKYADLLLRKRPQLGNVAYPLLAQIAERGDQAGVAALEQVLAVEPPWRTAFLRNLPRHIRDTRAPLALLLALKNSSAPPTDDELNAYLHFLISRKEYEFAYYVWLQALPADDLSSVGFLTNGSFEHTPSGSPFDWRILPGRGVTIDIAQRVDTDGERALHLEFGPGRANFRGVFQVVMLAPGRYELGGLWQGELTGKRGLQWTVRCLPSNKSIGETPMLLGAAPRWSRFAIEFDVPNEGCSAQEVRLFHASRSPSEELVSGAAWYDGVKLVRLDPED